MVFVFGFWFFGWLGQQVSPFFPFSLLDTVAGQESIPHKSPHTLVEPSLDTVEDVIVGEVDELEEDVG